MGCYEISLGDTLGVGVASDVIRLLEYLEKGGISKGMLAGHFHDTYGQALTNVWAAYQCGIRVFDSSVAGLGGCPYAPGAKGNLATEDVVYLFQKAGIETGVNLPELVEVGVWISEQLGIENSSRTGKALASKKNQIKTSPDRANGPSSLPNSSNSIQWAPHVSHDGFDILRSGANMKIILNRPHNGNALTTTMISNLTDFFERTACDSSISRIAITARGKFFCTGMDLAKGSTPVSQGPVASEAQYERLTRLFESIDSSPQVTIACVQGPAFGGGVGLAFACDIRIMAESASFTLSEVKLGLSPATISRYVVREWGAAFSREAMLSARRVLATELQRLGKVAQVVKTEAELLRALDLYLIRLKTAAPSASARSKELVRLGCLKGGRESTQGAGIKKLFGEMMSGNEEAVFGLAQFQAGNKTVDWDAYVSRQSNSKAKL